MRAEHPYYGAHAPKRWLDDYGWRPLTRTEVDASVAYYRQLGRRMNIKDLPTTYLGSPT